MSERVSILQCLLGMYRTRSSYTSNRTTKTEFPELLNGLLASKGNGIYINGYGRKLKGC